MTIAQTGNPLTFIGGGTGGAYGTNQQLSFQGVTTAEFCPGEGKGAQEPGRREIERLGRLRLFQHRAFAFSADGSIRRPCGLCPVPWPMQSATDYGNSAVGIATGPGQFNWDISIVKNTQITERVRMQFRSDFYNAFNHPQFAPPQGSELRHGRVRERRELCEPIPRGIS